MFKTSGQLLAFTYMCLSISVSNCLARGTNPLFDDRSVSEVYITINPDSLAKMLAPENAESYHEYPATFVFQTQTSVDTIENIGFRIRGNTSRGAAKKPSPTTSLSEVP